MPNWVLIQLTFYIPPNLPRALGKGAVSSFFFFYACIICYFDRNKLSRLKIHILGFVLSATPPPTFFNFKETAVTVLESSGLAEVTILRENYLLQTSYVSKYKEALLMIKFLLFNRNYLFCG